MIDVTYDPDADAVYIAIGRAQADHQTEAGPFICDVDADGRIVGIEVLPASKVLSPGRWQKARRPGETRFDAAE